MELDLQMFSEDAGAAGMGGAADTGMEGSGDAGLETQDTQGGSADDREFEQLINGRFKQQYGQRVQRAINQRFRNQQDLRKQLDGYTPIMQALGAKYGRDPSDVEGIGKLLTDDDSLYAEEASKLGLPIKTVKQMKKLEAENQRMQKAQQESQQDAALRQHFQKISTQAEELKKTFPSFDLMEEIKNPRFARMTSPEGGLSVKDAFYAIHGEEIQKQSMQYAAQQAGKRLAASVQSGANRPPENGMRSSQPVPMSVDVAHMSKEQRAAIRKRLHNGEDIDLNNM